MYNRRDSWVIALTTTQKLLRFGVYELNLTTEELRKCDMPIKLAPQPFTILALLASRAGQVVTREEIQKQIWGDSTYVDFEHGLNQCVKQIRGALNDNADRPVYVETVPRHGYRFLAPVVSKTILAPPPRVVESKSGVATVPGDVVAAAAPASGRTATAISLGDAGAAPLAGATATAAPPRVVPKREARSHVVLFRLAIALAVLGVLAAAAVYWRSRKISALTAKDTIVLADFKNSTGEKVFDDILKPALEFQLEQSPFLKLLSDQKVNDTLRMMGHAANEPLTPEIAREICLRTNSKALLGGTIAALEGHYQIELKATNCETGDTLAGSEAEAESRSTVLKAIRAVGNDMRQKLGESLASVKEYDQPLEEATTPSLDALQALSQARRAQITGSDPIPDFKRALELDPKFAAAYAGLGTAYDNQGQSMLAVQNYKKAYELRDRVSQHERFYIEANYADKVTGELEKADQIYAEWIRIYPDDYKPHNNLSLDYRSLGQYEKSADEALETIRLLPEQVFGYVNLAIAYNALNQLDKAKATYDDAEARKLDFVYLRAVRYFTAFLQRDDTVMQQEVEWAMGKQYAEDLLLATDSDTKAYYGEFQKARELSERAVQSAKHAASPETEASWKVNEALREAEIGSSAQAHRLAAEALTLSAGKDIAGRVALVFARSGDTAQAQNLVDKFDSEFPHDTIMQFYYLPSIRAAIELSRHNPQKALEVLQDAMRYEMGSPSSFGNLYPAYLRGEAYLSARQGQQAAVEFQKLIDHPGVVLNFVTGAVAHLQLARAQVMIGDKEAARKSYQLFLELWKTADPELPLRQAAQAEYRRLN